MILSSTVESYFNDLIYRWGHPLDFHMLDILVWSSIILYHVYICIPTYRVYLYIVEKSLDSYIFNTFLCVESCTSSEENTKGTLRLQGHEQPKHASVGNPVGFRGFWGFKTKVERDKHLSVQITIFHRPNFPWTQGISLPQLHFGEVAMIWRHLSQHLSFNNESIILSILNKLYIYSFRMFQGGSHFFSTQPTKIFHTSPTGQFVPRLRSRTSRHHQRYCLGWTSVVAGVG